MYFRLCCKAPVNVKQLQFSVGLSVLENGTETGAFVVGKFKKPKESHKISGVVSVQHSELDESLERYFKEKHWLVEIRKMFVSTKILM